jgi:hypothetical protein
MSTARAVPGVPGVDLVKWIFALGAKNNFVAGDFTPTGRNSLVLVLVLVVVLGFWFK